MVTSKNDVFLVALTNAILSLKDLMAVEIKMKTPTVGRLMSALSPLFDINRAFNKTQF